MSEAPPPSGGYEPGAAPPYGQQHYGQEPSYQGYPGYQTPPVVYVQGPGTNGLAIASLVLGILWLYWVGSLLAVIFGHVALADIAKTGKGGKGLAIAGLVLGYVGFGFMAMFLVIGILAAGT